MKMLPKKVTSIPSSAGIYQFFDKNKKIIYIGKAKDLKKRISSYFKDKNLGPKTNLMVSKISDIKIIKVFSEFEALLLEAELIKKYQPFYNIQAKDDKSPLYIKISDSQVPLISTTRNEKPKRGVFLKGPFPSAKTPKEILKTVRRIFKYCHHKNPKRPCLYVHLGLCPYPYQSKQAEQEYVKNITRIKKLLKGKTKQLIRELKKEMHLLSKDQKYEKAGEIKREIEKLQFLVTTYRTPREFLEKQTLVDDLALSKLKYLRNILELKTVPKRIECYDISNISGMFATGSMVAFENGVSARNQYRRFKIKVGNKPNDYQMLAEVLTRRFKNNWKYPDLIIIDGGRGQLNTSLNVISKLSLNIPVIAIAKKFEKIYTSDRIFPISLAKENPARQLVEEIRDESHRFAITYHRLLRSKNLLEEN